MWLLLLESLAGTGDTPWLTIGSHGVAAMLGGSFRENDSGAGVSALDFGALSALCRMMPTRPASDGPRNPRVTLLSESERDCLRLVYQHMTSKDIARRLGVSPHTVDMRLRQAIRKLEVTNRVEAARALLLEDITQGISPATKEAAEAQGENGCQPQYQPLIYQASDIVDDAKTATFGGPASQELGAAPNRSSDPNQLELGSLARTLHQPQSKPDVDPSGGSLAQPDALAGKVASAVTLATDWPGIAAPDPGIGARPFLTTRPYGQRNDLDVGHRLAWMMFIAFASALTFGGVLAAFAALKTLI